MSRDRVSLQYLLEDIMNFSGYVPHVYYQPPESIKLTYPCIVYNRSTFYTRYANNHIYNDMAQYTVTLMDKDPESSLVQALRDLEYCEMANEFTSENIHHFVFTLYY